MDNKKHQKRLRQAFHKFNKFCNLLNVENCFIGEFLIYDGERNNVIIDMKLANTNKNFIEFKKSNIPINTELNTKLLLLFIDTMFNQLKYDIKQTYDKNVFELWYNPKKNKDDFSKYIPINQFNTII